MHERKGRVERAGRREIEERGKSEEKKGNREESKRARERYRRAVNQKRIEKVPGIAKWRKKHLLREERGKKGNGISKLLREGRGARWLIGYSVEKQRISDS